MRQGSEASVQKISVIKSMVTACKVLGHKIMWQNKIRIKNQNKHNNALHRI
jgi:hypothetical protein